ncbi:MAG TPA: D-isomer specific 2-hydroxyacid dehydrogenase family protein [Verrucomicrobiae bacterium]|nr:D-isomer specific 2-hydroxyacid dehydrogenase family protein [Verrucomicrobiae bacterium]
MTRTGITVYGCASHEAILFRKMEPHYGVALTLIEATISETNTRLASGNRCISVDHKTQITASILRALRQVGVEYISTRSIGYNHIDMEYAKSVGITVGNVAYSPDSVADYTLMFMLMILRNVESTISRATAHDYRLNEVYGKELRDLTIGVIGTGRIGVAVIDRLRGFGCHVLAYDRHPKTSVEYVSLDELLRQSDVVSLHIPLTTSTYHLLDHRRIALMKHGTLIINTARGALVDTEVLVEALESGRLGGAALDVLEGEEGIFYSDYRNRAIDNKPLLRLQELPNVIITPHTAYYTDHALNDMAENSIVNCLGFDNGRVEWIGQKEKVA